MRNVRLIASRYEQQISGLRWIKSLEIRTPVVGMRVLVRGGWINDSGAIWWEAVSHKDNQSASDHRILTRAALSHCQFQFSHDTNTSGYLPNPLPDRQTVFQIRCLSVHCIRKLTGLYGRVSQ